MLTLDGRDRIPEPFIWQLLRDMARTVEHMSKIRFDGFENLGKHPFVLHLDLKDENSKRREFELLSHPS